MSAPTRETAEGHRCFGCGRQIGDHDPHIHVGLDEFAEKEGGLEQFGLDDLLTFAFCEACTERTDNGWAIESHEIPPPEVTA